jgi:hypothetical protein
MVMLWDLLTEPEPWWVWVISIFLLVLAFIAWIKRCNELG